MCDGGFVVVEGGVGRQFPGEESGMGEEDISRRRFRRGDDVDELQSGLEAGTTCRRTQIPKHGQTGSPTWRAARRRSVSAAAQSLHHAGEAAEGTATRRTSDVAGQICPATQASNTAANIAASESKQ